jgi:hypothetical protein
VRQSRCAVDRDWAEIGLPRAQVFPRWRFIEEEVHAVLGYARPIALNSTQAEDLRRLRRWLRHTIEQGAKAKGIGQSKRTRTKSPTN